MPWLHLETTADLPENDSIPEILEALVAELGRHETIEASSIKATHTLRAAWAVGRGHPPGFVHLGVGLLSGRSLGLRQTIGAGLAKVLSERFSRSLSAGEARYTLEIREMDRDTYLKGSS